MPMARRFPSSKYLCVLSLALALLPSAASAISGGTQDGADRFPFVVEVKLQNQMICSGTVLYPRIVVTAAHCLQHKVNWRGRQIYVEDYLGSSGLTVSVIHAGKTKSYEVAETVISPNWQNWNRALGAAARLPYDLALIVTKEPMAVGVAPNPLGGLRVPSGGNSPASGDDASALQDYAVPGVSVAQRPLRPGVLVGFGGESCASSAECGAAGVRRVLPVVMQDSSYCFRNRQLVELPPAVWCMESSVMPGDSGGALLVENDDGHLSYVGVISAQQGLPPELAAVSKWQRSLASALYSNLNFILAKANELGYGPALTSGP